jgi:glutathione S-transferase
VKRFTLYGSPHSLPTYKVALMLRLAGEPFSFRYVSFQKGMHKTAEFLALSRWGQVPVLVDSGRIYHQSAAIVEHLAQTLGRLQGGDAATRRPAGTGCTGMSMCCFHRFLAAMAFSSVSENFCRSASSR